MNKSHIDLENIDLLKEDKVFIEEALNFIQKNIDKDVTRIEYYDTNLNANSIQFKGYKNKGDSEEAIIINFISLSEPNEEIINAELTFKDNIKENV